MRGKEEPKAFGPDYPGFGPKGSTPTTGRPRLLWASTSCLLDTSGGWPISVRQALLQLAKANYEVAILGATIFLSERGMTRVGPFYHRMKEEGRRSFTVSDGYLVHHLLVTESTDLTNLKYIEQLEWFNLYRDALNRFKPDLIWFEGGLPFDYLIPYEARLRGIPSAAYLTHTKNRGGRWVADVDEIIVDSQATAAVYSNRDGFTPIPVGKFVAPATVIPATHVREMVTFINPSLHKGGAVVVVVAWLLERRRPDILFEVVESRGDWSALVRRVTGAFGQPKDILDNVIVSQHTDDMRPIYARSKILLVPSLFFESGARVIVEALLNGIPVIATNRGGITELVGDGGILFDLPDPIYQPPYSHLPTPEMLYPIADHIETLFDDPAAYQDLVDRAYGIARRKHDIAANTQRLLEVFNPLVRRRCADGADRFDYQRWHKHGLAPDPASLLASAYESDDKRKPFGKKNIYRPLSEGEKGLFIDCGGYDGCSAIKFISENQDFDCITFEPNPDLWDYYKEVPTTLIRKGVAGATGRRNFTIDSIDFDGSSLIEEKRIDHRGEIHNKEFPKIIIACIDIDEVLRATSGYDVVILKLDIEGAEYEVLERLLETGNISCIHKLYIEWHWEKCAIPYAQHEALLQQLSRHLEFEEWDALDFSVHKQSDEKKKSRSDFVRTVLLKPVKEYQKPPEDILIK